MENIYNYLILLSFIFLIVHIYICNTKNYNIQFIACNIEKCDVCCQGSGNKVEHGSTSLEEIILFRYKRNYPRKIKVFENIEKFSQRVTTLNAKL